MVKALKFKNPRGDLNINYPRLKRGIQTYTASVELDLVPVANKASDFFETPPVCHEKIIRPSWIMILTGIGKDSVNHCRSHENSVSLKFEHRCCT